jgi:hypothetical protein
MRPGSAPMNSGDIFFWRSPRIQQTDRGARRELSGLEKVRLGSKSPFERRAVTDSLPSAADAPLQRSELAKSATFGLSQCDKNSRRDRSRVVAAIGTSDRDGYPSRAVSLPDKEQFDARS